MQEKMKVCSKCKKEKPATRQYFYVDRNAKSGFKSRCKICEGNSYAINNKYGHFDIEWKELGCLSGIYKITCEGNDKIYIGSAVNFCMRWSVHLDHLRKNKHHASYMQNSFNKYGKDSFKFEIVEFVPDENMLIKREQFWLDKLTPYDRSIGFNTLKIAGSALGHKLSDVTKKKLSVSLGKTVLQYSKDGDLIERYDSTRSASKELRLSHGEICNCANGKKLTYKGFIWVYENSEITLESKLNEIKSTRRTVLQYGLDGKLIKEWDCTVSEIANVLDKKFLNIPLCILGKQDTLGGYIWRYREGNEKLVKNLNVNITKKGKKEIVKVVDSPATTKQSTILS